MLHFSGKMKMWDRPCFFASTANAEFAELLIRESGPIAYRRWIERANADEYSEFGVEVVDDKAEGRRLLFGGKPLDERVPMLRQTLGCFRQALLTPPTVSRL